MVTNAHARRWPSALAALALLSLVPRCQRQPTGDDDATPPAVAGPGQSWLGHLGVAVDATPLGHQGGGAELGPSDETAGPTFAVTGADLYRYSCRSCHGPRATGAPPLIPSLLDPISGTSPDLLAARLQKQTGSSPDRALLVQISQSSEQAIRKRLRDGGEKMPAFAYLRPAEIDALLTYLRGLAGAAPASPPAPISESPLRVGQLVVDGTCHICHDTTGPGGHRAVMMRGIVPSLASMAREPLSLVLEKVQSGQVAMMGARMGMRGHMGMGGRGGPRVHTNRMPAFPYFSPREIAAAYQAIRAGDSP